MIEFRIDATQREPTVSIIAEIADQQYTIDLRWRDRIGAWYMSLADGQGNSIWRCRRLMVNQLIGQDLQGESLPPGEFATIDYSLTGVESGYGDLGERCMLVYMDPDEVVFPGEVQLTLVPYTIEAVV